MFFFFKKKATLTTAWKKNIGDGYNWKTRATKKTKLLKHFQKVKKEKNTTKESKRTTNNNPEIDVHNSFLDFPYNILLLNGL